MDNEFVPKYYEMDPATEDLLFTGSELREDMVVLAAWHGFRIEIMEDIELFGWRLEQARRYNRWATVHNPTIMNNQLHFIAEYEDGTKKKITTSWVHAWFVKKNSLPTNSTKAHKDECPSCLTGVPCVMLRGEEMNFLGQDILGRPDPEQVKFLEDARAAGELFKADPKQVDWANIQLDVHKNSDGPMPYELLEPGIENES